jgi:hypothetical protein
VETFTFQAEADDTTDASRTALDRIESELAVAGAVNPKASPNRERGRVEATFVLEAVNHDAATARASEILAQPALSALGGGGWKIWSSAGPE